MAMPAFKAPSAGEPGQGGIPLDRLPQELHTPLVLVHPERDQDDLPAAAQSARADSAPELPDWVNELGQDSARDGSRRAEPLPADPRSAGRPRRPSHPRRAARKRPLRRLAQAEDSPSFYLSLSDLMSLLLVFFVLIFSLTNPLAAGRPVPPPEPAPATVAAPGPRPADEAVTDPLAMPQPLPEDVTQGILAVTGQGQADPGLASALAKPPREDAALRRAAESQAMSRELLRLVTASRPVALAALPREDARLSELVRVVKGEMGGRQGASVEARKQSVLVRLDEAITFDQGRAELKPDMRAALAGLAGIIAQHPEAKVVVSGHTDDLPIATAEFPSNWELSAARAATVARALMAQGTDPARFTIRGLADQRPLASNQTPLGRQLNRRVEIELWPGQPGAGQAG